MKNKVAIIGSGAWGTALAQVLNDNKQSVILYSNKKEQVDEINNFHTNSFYLPGAILSENIKATNNLNDAIRDSDIILLAVPSNALRTVLKEINSLLEDKKIFINTAKGFDTDSYNLLSYVFYNSINNEYLKDFVSLIGPSHAEEVIKRDLTCITATCTNEEIGMQIAKLFSNSYFRVYLNKDVIGGQIGAAYKNAIAIASGILEGLNYGDNSRAALCSRGLAEMVRFGLKYGGKEETFLGLTGMGDLVVTCYSRHSRNFTAGFKIGKDDDASIFLKTNTKTVEGIRTIKVLYEISLKDNVELPIIQSLYRIIYLDKKPSKEVIELMNRPLKSEK